MTTNLVDDMIETFQVEIKRLNLLVDIVAGERDASRQRAHRSLIILSHVDFENKH